MEVISRMKIYRDGRYEVLPEPKVPDYIIALDLGKSLDYTALCILETYEKENPKEGVYYCRHLHRYKLGTSYPAIVLDVSEICQRPPLRFIKPWLVIDGTGVGNAVLDLFRQTPINANIRAVVIHGGDTATYEHGVYRVPKRELVGSVQVGLQTRRLKIAPDLPEVGILTQELQTFQVKINEQTVHDSYEARVGQHDDYVLATAISLWFGQNQRRVWECY